MEAASDCLKPAETTKLDYIGPFSTKERPSAIELQACHGN